MIKQKNKWLVLVGIKPQFIKAYQAADELGLNVLSITQFDFPVPKKIRPEKLAITEDLSLANLKKIIKKELKGEKIAAVYTVREESMLAVSILNKEIKNKCVNPHKMLENFRDKHAVRELLKKTPYTIETTLVDLENPRDPFPGYKKVVKPLSDGGSTGVILVNKGDDFAAAVAASKKAYFKNIYIDNMSSKQTLKKSERYILVEKFIEGKNYIAEMFIHKGKPLCLSVCQRAEMIPPYFEEAYDYAPADLPKKIYDFIANESEKIIKTLKIPFGPIHMELIYNEGKITVVEINLRSGGSGWFNTLIEESTGMEYIKAVLTQITGGNPWPLLKPKTKNVVLLYVPLARKGGYIKGMPKTEKLSVKPLDYNFNFKIGDFIPRRPEFITYLGYYMFKVKGQSKKSFDKIHQIIKEGDTHLQFRYQETPLKK